MRHLFDRSNEGRPLELAFINMSTGEVANYEGDLEPEVIQDGFNKWIKCYNDGSALPNGTVVVVSFAEGADLLAPQAVAPATNSDPLQLVGVVDNTKLRGQTQIAASEWGFVQVAGYHPAVISAAGNIVDEHYLEVLNAGTAATDDGASKTTKSFGIAKGAATTPATFPAILFGKEVVVAAA